jgi:acyl-CoA dehydrogenase
MGNDQMNFDFSDELNQLREEARRFLADRCPPSVPRRILDGDEPYAAELWKAIAEMGWTGAAIPEEYGGVGLGRLAVCVIAEELGRAVAPIPYASSVYLATEAIMLFGSEAQKQSFLPKLAAGELIGTFAMAERAGPADAAKLTANVAGGKLTGVKLAVPDGDIADFAVVAVNGGSGAWLYLVDLKEVRREVVATIDPTRSHARIEFAGATAEPLPGANGADSVRRLLDYAAVPMAFEQVGGAEAALDMANAYAKERYAFGRPIGSFQGIKHKLADMYIQVQLARSNAYYGAWAVHTAAAELPIAACVARISACEAGWFVTKENIQTHGGMGFTWQMDCHLYYRRAKVLGLALGGAREWKRRLVAELRTRNATLEAA